MSCVVCDKPHVGNVLTDDYKKVEYCNKHESDVKIAVVMLEEDPKALDKLIKKYKSKQHGKTEK